MMVQPKRKSNSNSSQCKSRAAEPLSAAPCGAVDGQSRPLREEPRGIRGRGRAKARESATRGSSTTALTARSPLSASLLTFEEKGRSVAVVLEQVRSRGPGLHSRSQPADDVALGREGWFSARQQRRVHVGGQTVELLIPQSRGCSAESERRSTNSPVADIWCLQRPLVVDQDYVGLRAT